MGHAGDNAAGIGVFWGEEPGVDDLSERVPGAQKSGRAELYVSPQVLVSPVSANFELQAIFRALEEDPDKHRQMVVYSDSEYAINGKSSRRNDLFRADYSLRQP